jgi:exonuclease III
LLFLFTINRNLRILEWNANSVYKKKAELEIFLQTNSIDIAAICETKLLPKYKFNIPGYKAYRSDRNQFRGGVMLLVVLFCGIK